MRSRPAGETYGRAKPSFDTRRSQAELGNEGNVRGASSLTGPKLFVVAACFFGILRRDRVAVERDDGLFRIAAKQFFGDSVGQFGERLGNLNANEVPVGLLG